MSSHGVLAVTCAAKLVCLLMLCGGPLSLVDVVVCCRRPAAAAAAAAAGRRLLVFASVVLLLRCGCWSSSFRRGTVGCLGEAAVAAAVAASRPRLRSRRR